MKKTLFLIVLAFVCLSMTGCLSTIANLSEYSRMNASLTDEEKAVENENIALFAGEGTLGGGYRDLKWGMTKKSVRSILWEYGYKFNTEMPSSNLNTTVESYVLEERKEIRAFYYDGILYGIKYYPAINGTFVSGLETELYNQLIEKYGSGQEVTSILSEFRTFYWKDEYTEIDFYVSKYWSPSSDENVYLSYVSTLVLQKRNDEQRMREEKAQNDKIEEMRGEI